MTIEELRKKVFRDLDSRGLADPSIRKRALNKVLSFIQTNEFYCRNGELSLPIEKGSLKSSYQKWKGIKLNSAESSVINTMYEHYNGKTLTDSVVDNINRKNRNKETVEIIKSENTVKVHDIEKELIQGNFLSINELQNGEKIPDVPGLYCIKLRPGVFFPKDFGMTRKDGIIYIGIATTSLNQRLWEQELNHKKPATFFRSIGAMLGYLPPKGSLVGKKNTRNYKFSEDDTEKIKNWMRQSLLVNFVSTKCSNEEIEEIEKSLIKKFSPLVNIEHNDNKSQALIDARAKCVQWANML